jgi:hypothetical protein
MEVAEDMTRLELLALFLSLQSLLEVGNVESAKKVVDELVSEARKG